jgi:hypothetical protein
MTVLRRPIVAVCAVVAVLLAACSDGGGAAPTSPVSVTTPPASTTTTSSPKLSAGVPSVREPLDISAFLAEPCKAVTEPQRQALGQKGVILRPGERYGVAPVPTCSFADYQHEQKGDLFVDVSYRDDVGISPLYDAHAKGFSPEYWSPGELAGYPVVYYTERTSPENCYVAIGTSDTSRVGIRLNRLDIYEPREKGSCAILSQIAEAVLTTIRDQ